MSDKFYVGLDLTGFENNGVQRPVSRVTLRVDEERVLTAGDDSGFELAADCPHATQAMVNSILARVRGFQYQMYEASDINIDPAAELGDGITAGGVYAVIARVDDDGSGFPSASAPGEAELEDEYPSGGPMTKEFNRKMLRRAPPSPRQQKKSGWRWKRSTGNWWRCPPLSVFNCRVSPAGYRARRGISLT